MVSRRYLISFFERANVATPTSIGPNQPVEFVAGRNIYDGNLNKLSDETNIHNTRVRRPVITPYLNNH